MRRRGVQAAAALVIGLAAAGSWWEAFAGEGPAVQAAPEAAAAVQGAEAAEPAEDTPQSLIGYIRKRWGIDGKRAEEVVAAAQAAAAKVSVDPLLLLAVIARESKFTHFGNPKHLAPDAKGQAVDPMQPHGPMQVAGRWHRDKMPRNSQGQIRPTTLRENVLAGAQVLREYLEFHGGNLRRALQQYNGCRTNNCDRYPSHVLEMRQDFERVVGRERRD